MNLKDPTIERCEAEIARLRAWLNAIDNRAIVGANNEKLEQYVEIQRMANDALAPDHTEVEFPRRKTGDERITIGLWPSSPGGKPNP